MLCVVLNCSDDAYFWFKLAAWGRLPSSRMYVNGHYNPLVRIMTQFLTPLMQCMSILYMSGGTQSLIESIHFLEFAQQFFIYCQSFYQKSVEIKSPKKFFFCFSFSWICRGRGLKRGRLTTYQTVVSLMANTINIINTFFQLAIESSFHVVILNKFGR